MRSSSSTTLFVTRGHAAPGTAGLAALLALAVPLLTACAGQAAPDPGPAPAVTVQAEGPVRAGGGMVVSASAIASEVGARVLAEGGNAVDAAVATGFALAVTYPTAGNIGGGGFMVIRFPDGRTTAIDFREKAPLASHPDMFLDEDGEYSSRIHHSSHVAVGVPGTVAGLAMAQGKYGNAAWADLVEPAVRLASDGFVVPAGLARSLGGVLGTFQERSPAAAAAYSKDGVPYQAGERLVLADLGRTLERIKLEGHDGFYRGETARLLAAEMERGGGLITEEDLARYQAVERETVRGTYRGYEVISMPPPSSGGVALLEMLNILEGFDLAAMGHNSASYVHHVAEAMRRAYRDRARHLGDTDFVAVPIERLTSKAYAAELRTTIDPARATPSATDDIAQAYESEHTTHYSVVDASGMAVSVTYTLEQGYGSKLLVPGAGFLLNNEMGDFNPRAGLTTEGGLIGTDANLVRPEKRMLSSMTPSILARDGQLVAVVGSPGGRTIINTVLQVVLNVVDHDMGIQDAVNAGRFHHQWLPDRISAEGDAFTDAVLTGLEAMGHEVSARGGQGTAHSIMVDAASGELVGAPDPRDRDAGAAGVGARAGSRADVRDPDAGRLVPAAAGGGTP